MPSDYTVEQVALGEQWDHKDGYGTFQPYELTLKGMAGTYQLNRKLRDGQVPENKVPTPGQVLFLSINGDRAKEERRDQAPQQAMNGGGSSSPQEDAVGYRTHPEAAARMGFAKALELAPVYFRLFDPDGKPTKDRLIAVAAWLAGLIDEAGLDAVKVPEPEPSAAAEYAAKSDEDIPFHRLPVPDFSARRRDVFTGDRWLA